MELAKMFKLMESLPEEEETDSESTETGSMEDSSVASSPSSSREAYSTPSLDILPPPSPLLSPVNTRSGKARKTKYRKPFYKVYKGEGVVYLPRDIKARLDRFSHGMQQKPCWLQLQRRH